MTRAQALRVIALASQVEMALVRRDAVAGALLAQAARAVAEGPAADRLRAASDLSRATDLTADEPARKVAQALNRVALQEAQAAALR
jgi:hypothetical protein